MTLTHPNPIAQVTQGLPEQDLEQVQVSSQKQEDGLAATAQSGWDKLEQWVAEVESHRETMHKYPATTLGQIEGDTLSNASKKDMSIASMSISTAEQNIRYVRFMQNCACMHSTLHANHSTVQSTVCSTGGSSHVRCSSRGAPSTPGPSAAEFPLKLVDCDEASEVSTPKPVTTDSQSPWENSLDKE